MKQSDLMELEIEQEGLKLRISRGPGGQFITSGHFTQSSQSESPSQPVLPASAPAADDDDPEEGYVYVRSPMVGTFYRSAAPDMPPFVENNQKVNEETVICIIEAMKVMNEIQAEVKGTIVDILVENAQPVEYGQPLLKVRKD